MKKSEYIFYKIEAKYETKQNNTQLDHAKLDQTNKKCRKKLKTKPNLNKQNKFWAIQTKFDQIKTTLTKPNQNKDQTTLNSS